jgi:DNA ligase D-like protein (predicted polymerase)
VSLTNLNKVLFPAREGEEPVTKRDLIGYYAQVAPFLLPYLFDRAVNLHRFPNGAAQGGFWQKEIPGHAPDWLTRWYFAEASEGKTECFAVLDSVASLVWMANYAAVELHPWTSSTRDSQQPTWALIDIEPGTATTFEQIVELAGLYQVALEHLNIEGMPKVTGKQGVQIWVPVADGYTFEDTRTWVQMLSRTVGRTLPELISWEWQKDPRWPGPPRLHAERDHQDPRRAVQHPTRARGAGVGPDRLGRTAGPRPTARPLGSARRPGTHPDRRRPDGRSHHGNNGCPICRSRRAAQSRQYRAGMSSVRMFCSIIRSAAAPRSGSICATASGATRIE